MSNHSKKHRRSFFIYSNSNDINKKNKYFWAYASLVASVASLGLVVPYGAVFSSANISSTKPSTTTTASLDLTGYGWGHGRGMGQYGALGYAIDGNSYTWILNHYYGGTTLATVPNNLIKVRIMQLDGLPTIVTSGSAFSIGNVQVSAGGAAMMAYDSTTSSWNISTAASTAGPWTIAGNTTTAPTAISSVSSPSSTSQMLQLCLGSCNTSSPNNVAYRGTIQAVLNSSGSQRTVNTLPLEQYLLSVVPSEMPGYWGTLNGGNTTPSPQSQAWGFQALEAQAVAARSYAQALMNENNGNGSYGYADICNTSQCQNYLGASAEYGTSSIAVQDTAGQVLDLSNGQVALTEYSSSTGGYTAGGVYPAVVDAGDSICIQYACNYNHTWTQSIPVANIEAFFPSIGTYQSLNITQRNGFGALGGRVENLQIIGGSGSVTISGNTFAADFGLKSNWFGVSGGYSKLSSPAVAMAEVSGGNGYWQVSANGGVGTFNANFYGSMEGQSLNKPIVGMASTPNGQGYWLVASDGGIFSFGNANFYGSTGGMTLNKPIVGMASTPNGQGYWLVASDGGVFSFGNANFQGSTGSMTLNKPVVGMAVDPATGGYWLVASDGGIFSFNAPFYGSTGSMTLNKPIIGMAATPNGGGYWLVASDGGVFTFGNAKFYGSTGGTVIASPIVGIANSFDGQGYWESSVDGSSYNFGDASKIS